jgi:hypothetical protein
VKQTTRGIILFVTVLITIGIWAPLRNRPERLPNGAVLTETYFGVLTYLTLSTETKEPNFHFEWSPNYKRLALTGLLTAGLWAAAFTLTRRKNPGPHVSPGEPSA